MRGKSTLILLIAVIIAGIVAYSLSKKPTSEELAGKQMRVLDGFVAKNIATVEIEADGKRIACARDGAAPDRWLITAPMKLRADRNEIESILRDFEEAERTGRLIRAEKGKALDLAEYGLDRPTRTASFREAPPSTRSWTLLVGRNSPVGNLLYAAPSDKSLIYTIDKSVAEALDATLNDLRSKKLTEQMDAAELTAVEIQASKWHDSEGFSLTCGKQGDRWELREPIHDLADTAAITGLANRINQHTLKSADFVADEGRQDSTLSARAGDYGLDSPALSVTFRLAEQSYTIVLGCRENAEGETFYAMNKAEGAIVQVPTKLFEDLRKGPNELRERSVVSFVEDDVEKIRIARGGALLELDKADGKWQVAGEKTAKADDVVVGALIHGLKDARVEQFVADAPTTLDQYALDEGRLWNVALVGGEDKLLAQLQIGADDEDGKLFYARRPGYAPALAVAKKPFVGDVRSGRLAMLDRLMLQEPETQAIELKLVTAEHAFRCERKDSGSDWKLLEPVHGPADQSAVRRIVGGFASLRAAGLAAESADDLSPYGLDSPTISVEVTYLKPKPKGEKEGNVPPETYVKRLLVGAGSEEIAPGFFASVEGGPRVFVLGAGTVEDLRAGLASKVICEAKGIWQVDFSVGGGAARSFTYDRKGAVWTGAGGEALDDDLREKVAAAANLLERFTGTGVTAYIVKDPAAYGFDKPALSVSLKDEHTEGKVVTIGRQADDQGWYATGPASSYVLVASAQDVEKLLAAANAVEPPAE